LYFSFLALFPQEDILYAHYINYTCKRLLKPANSTALGSIPPDFQATSGNLRQTATNHAKIYSISHKLPMHPRSSEGQTSQEASEFPGVHAQ